MIVNMSLFSRLRKRPGNVPVERFLPDGMLLYAIGDIHGRDDLFAQLLDMIERDRDNRPHSECVVILLGDLVDRGPDSDKVVERALSLHTRFDKMRHLLGNHEECLLAALAGDVRALRYFIRIGGDATIRSYLRDDALYDNVSFEQLAVIFPTYVPQTHVDFLRRSEDLILLGDYVFVHAGVRPGVPLDCQSKSDLRWIREDFLSANDEFGAMVVHGHTISDKVEMRQNRIGIDTGAYCYGALTALGLAGSSQWIIQSSR